MHIREANSDDAIAACTVIRRSIVELCVDDHDNNPAIPDGWLANKTPENVRAWIANSNNVILVAADGRAILGVGAVTNNGEITLNYVSPDARFRGVSKAILRELEARAAALGNGRCTLTSTLTAQELYVSAGYTPDATDQRRAGSGTPMAKLLP